MSLFKTLIFKPCHHRISCLNNPLSLSAVRTLNSSASSDQPQNQPNTEKPLRLLFQEAVGLASPETTSHPATVFPSETNQVKRKLLELEQEVRVLREAGAPGSNEGCRIIWTRKKNVALPKPNNTSLYALFTSAMPNMSQEKRQSKRSMSKSKPTPGNATKNTGAETEGKRGRTREGEPEVLKKLSPDMEMFVNHLYRLGYFRNANFVRGDRLDLNCFNHSYSRRYIVFAAEKFGQDHQDIAGWLSGKDLKKVALFGCPPLSKKNVFSAKKLRKYFKIQEDTVCGRCILKDSCISANKGIDGDNSLSLAVVMRVITLYALEGVNSKVSVPDEIKNAVCRLFGEVIKLTNSA